MTTPVQWHQRRDDWILFSGAYACRLWRDREGPHDVWRSQVTFGGDVGKSDVLYNTPKVDGAQAWARSILRRWVLNHALYAPHAIHLLDGTGCECSS